MDNNAAKKLIRDTFESPFDKGRFINLSQNLVKHLDGSKNFTYQGNIIPDAYEQSIQTLERVGKYEDAGGNKIDILIVRLKKEQSLERARTMQRNFVAWYLNGSRGGELKDAALVAFVSPDSLDWRFSLVRMDYNLATTPTGRTKVEKELTPARRYSFLVGENESSHTAQGQLLPILLDDERKPLLSDFEKAFNIEVVTREFFEAYKRLYLAVKEELDKAVVENLAIQNEFSTNKVDTDNFAKKLLGQIVFLYFLQKKGWLGVPQDMKWGDGDKRFLRSLFNRAVDKQENFFNLYLEYLFYDALARQDRGTMDPAYYPRFTCKIPFLNGGLFDPIGSYDWEHTDILLLNDLFSNKVKTKE
ncbi:MAG: class I SAM-dependent DNA methyltransferase, partial [Dehalococcoidia bacterium]|nr:class I SAM-dependent DNA methyltransferase [Dehalococcoidia bacterium]